MCNAFNTKGSQMVPLWQPVIADADNRANATQDIERSIFRYPMKWTRSQPRRRNDFLVFGGGGLKNTIDFGLEAALAQGW